MTSSTMPQSLRCCGRFGAPASCHGRHNDAALYSTEAERMPLCPVCGNPGFLGLAANPQAQWCGNHYPGPLCEAERAAFRGDNFSAIHVPLGPLTLRRTLPEEHGCALPGALNGGPTATRRLVSPVS